MEPTNTTGASFSTRHFGTATVITHSYQNGNQLAVELIDERGEPITVLSVNIPECAHLLHEKEFFVKTWSENEELAKDALASGLFQDTGRTSGDAVNAKIWVLK